MSFFAIYAVLSPNWFVAIYALCVEKILAKNSVRGEKMTNIRYEQRFLQKKQGLKYSGLSYAKPLQMVSGWIGGWVLAVLAPDFPSRPASTLILSDENILPRQLDSGSLRTQPALGCLGGIPIYPLGILQGALWWNRTRVNSVFCHQPTRNWRIFEEMEQGFRQLNISSGGKSQSVCAK